MRRPRIQLQWWEGCPSTDAARAELRAALDDIDLAAAEIEMVEIRDDRDAQRSAFRGSPTILIDGVDPFAADVEADPVGLTCRVYRRRDGRISPTPDPYDLREALRARALQTESAR